MQLERIAAIAFATLEKPSPTTALVWTDDGTIVRAGEIGYQPSTGWRFTLADPLLAGDAAAKQFGEGAARPAAILFDPTAVTPLVACGAPQYSASTGAYRYETAPQVRIDSPDQSMLGLGSIELDGPIAARFTLPVGLSNPPANLVFSAELALVEPVPADARATVTVRFGKSPPQEIVLDVTTRRVQVRVEGRAAPDATLEIILGDGGNGVAGDRIAIHRGCFIRQG